MSSFLVNLFAGRNSVPNRLPLDDINRALASFCTLPPRDVKTQTQPRISSSSFKNIGNVLKEFEAHTGQTGWSYRPRIYTILRAIGRLDVMPYFVSMQYMDLQLPFSLHTLPQELGESRPAFIGYQEHVLTDAKELEKGIDGKHVQFSSSGDEHFFVHTYLGSGGFGYVDHIWSRLSHIQYARKRFHRGNTSRDNQEGFRRFEQEIRALKGLSHRHLVNVVGSYSDQQCFAFLMRPVADCNLLVFLQGIKSQELPTLRSFFGCLTNAIAYLHNRKIQHMDIKPENILIKNGEVYVADFGAAHDWSKKERSTTWSAAPRTPRYIPPEVARDAHSPRNSSTDMWSLGVVFLEMVTVLRGRRVEHLRQYLAGHGTKHAYVYGNAPATYSWFEVLRKSDAGPDFDNEPLTWIKDLIQPDPLNRPNAKALVRQLLESASSEKFCGFCCSSPAELDWVEPPISNRSHVHDTITVIVDDEDSEYGRYRSQFDSSGGQVLPEAKTQSIEAWLNLGEDNMSPDPANYGLEPSVTESSELPYEVDDDNDVTQIASATLVPNKVPQRLSNFDFFGDQRIQESSRGNIKEQEEEDIDNLAYDVVSDGSESYGSEATVRPAVPSSDPELAAILEDLDEEPLSPKHSVFAPSTGSHPQAMATSTSQSKVPYGTPHISHHGGPEIRRSVPGALLSSPTTHFVLPNLGISSHVSMPSFQPLIHDTPQPQLSRPHAHTLESNVVHPSPVPNSNSAPPAPLPSSVLGISDSRPPIINRDSVQPPLLPPSQPKGSNVPSRLTIENLRKLETPKPEKAKLTSKKLKGRSRTKPKISAKVYMQDIWEAESSAATSVISEGTRSKIGGGSLTHWQDKTHNFLGHYAKEGKAAAVRLLLEKNCNPGTKEKPRPGPLFSAVKGASARHTKCVRILLEFGADVNVKQYSTGKTPLHFAIEHRNFKGYGNLIYTLLGHGANPNVKDASGDFPLLQILYGGYEPLEKHKRDALALLLEQTHFTTDVNIMPPGTQNAPLHLAVRRKDPWAVGMLLETEAKVNEPNGAGVTPFAMAASSWSELMTNEQKEVVELLLYHGAHVNVKIGSTGSTALQIAITHGRADMVELLIDYDADPEAKDNAGQSAFDIARRSINSNKISVDAHAKIMRSLFETVDIDIPLEPETCAIVTAVRYSDLSAAACLLKYGADANHRYDVEKYPLLRLAVINKDLDMVKLLSKHGALNEPPNSNQFNAVEFAKSTNHREIQKFLRQVTTKASQ
ncbi:hypothetical protein MMC11_004683 [Xylographa trunciseda]|nr:hypothetical protein [Xylographa trunciseda]